MTKQEAIEHLKKLLKPGDEVYTLVDHVSSSGMFRVIRAFIVRDSQPQDISWAVARVIGHKHSQKHNGVEMSGCGMDMGFELVYCLGRAIFHNGFTCIGKKCPSNDHFNGDRNYRKHKHSDAGYALIQRWL